MVEWDGKRVIYTHEIKKVKNITMRISEDGKLIVSSNEFVPVAKIDDFVKDKVDWILKKQEVQKNKIERVYTDANLQDYFYLYDTRLRIVRLQSNQNGVRFDHENLYVYYIKEEDIHKNVVKFIYKQCEQDFVEVVHEYYEKMQSYGFAFPKITFKTMKGKWGSCTPRKKTICLNTRMLHYPKAFMEYVVLHELVHFVEPNHSTSFYRVIEYYMHDYKERMKLMKE